MTVSDSHSLSPNYRISSQFFPFSFETALTNPASKVLAPDSSQQATRLPAVSVRIAAMNILNYLELPACASQLSKSPCGGTPLCGKPAASRYSPLARGCIRIFLMPRGSSMLAIALLPLPQTRHIFMATSNTRVKRCYRLIGAWLAAAGRFLPRHFRSVTVTPASRCYWRSA